MSSKELILGRIRRALTDIPPTERPEDVPVRRDYRSAHHPEDTTSMLGLLAENLADYRAIVHRCSDDEVPAVVARLLADRGSRSLAVPEGVPADWLPADPGLTVVRDAADLTPNQLDAVDSVLTGCAVAIAETGTLVLDAGPGQGRRALTLVPDHHICVVRVPEQVVASLPRALPRLDPRRPLTWISGPSATSDIELDRVEGVHGPRTLEVVLAG